MAESVYKSGPRKGFTTVYRAVAQDERLSLKARGLFLLLQSLPEDWNYTVSGLAATAGTGKDQIRSALKELLEVGYLVKEQSHDGGGKFSGNVFVLQEEAPPLSDNPSTVFPSTEKPSTGNPTVNNNNINIPPYNPPKGGSVNRKKTKSIPVWKPDRFEKFWEYYSTHVRGENRAKAVRAWDKLRPDDELIAAMGRALERQIQTDEWKRGIGRPHASTWLNNERWKDVGAAKPTEEPAPHVPRYVGTKMIDGQEVDVFE